MTDDLHDLPGTVCLQGGREFGDDCLPMDSAVLEAAGPGRVVVLASAGRQGQDYAQAGANAARHYRAAGATDVVVAPDPRDDPAGAVAALTGARVVVLPGGSPSSLHAALMADGEPSPAGEQLLATLAAGGAVMGSSAGAMVLCARTVLPDSGRRVVAGLGAVPGALALVHWSGPGGGWESLGGDGALVGLPEASGLMVRRSSDGSQRLTAVGVSSSGVKVSGKWKTVVVGESVTLRV